MPKFIKLFFKVAVTYLTLFGTHSLANENSFTFYGKLYPEWRTDQYSPPSIAGTNVGTMGTLKNDTQILANNATTKENSSDWAWSNSYVALKFSNAFQSTKFGFDYQLIVDTAGDNSAFSNVKNNLDTRDAFVFIENDYGNLLFGKMDSIYKDWGDKYPMLGISSGNLVSTSRILSNTSWRGNGDRSFHNRRNNMLTYYSPKFHQFQFGGSYSFNEGENGPGGPGTELSAIAGRWSNESWYFSLAHEIHHNWLSLSKNEINPAANSIKNDSRSTNSKDMATRFSVGWKNRKQKIAFDIAKLAYTESSSVMTTGKFLRYENHTAQFSTEYKIHESLAIAYNFSIGSPGQCSLTGGLSCTTTGLGGYQNSLGAMYKPVKNIGIFMIASEIRNRNGSRYASASQGSMITSYATGLKIQF